MNFGSVSRFIWSLFVLLYQLFCQKGLCTEKKNVALQWHLRRGFDFRSSSKRGQVEVFPTYLVLIVLSFHYTVSRLLKDLFQYLGCDGFVR